MTRDLIKVYTVVLLLGDLPYIRAGSFLSRREAVEYVWEEYSLFAKADAIDKQRVKDQLEIYAAVGGEKGDDTEEWNPWYSGADFRMHIKAKYV